MHRSRSFLSDAEEVVWTKSSGVGVVFFLFCWGDRIWVGNLECGVGDDEWRRGVIDWEGVFFEVGEFFCWRTAILAGTAAEGDDMMSGSMSLVHRGVLEFLVLEGESEDGFFAVDGYEDSFVVDVSSFSIRSGSPRSPV